MTTLTIEQRIAAHAVFSALKQGLIGNTTSVAELTAERLSRYYGYRGGEHSNEVVSGFESAVIAHCLAMFAGVEPADVKPPTVMGLGYDLAAAAREELGAFELAFRGFIENMEHASTNTVLVDADDKELMTVDGACPNWLPHAIEYAKELQQMVKKIAP